MKIVRNLPELDDILKRCDAATSDDALREIFSGFMMDMARDVPADPFSPEYAEYQAALYRRISGRHYDLANEATPFDLESAVLRPFPYSTASCQTAGDHFVMIGQFLRHLKLAPQSRIVEFGPGWGNLTLALAALGHHVTAVDVEPRFCELIRRRADRLGLALEVINADFSWASSVTQPFDAIVFFECFHHAADHLNVLRALHKAVKPGGRVYLGAEPILADFPVPWGLRMDGQSLWSIRKFGWMELGFRDDYFSEALARTGWEGIRHPLPDPAIWELQSAHALHFDAGDSRLGTLSGRREGSEILLENAASGVALFGPYASLGPGDYVARIHLRGPASGTGQMEISAQSSALRLRRASVDAGDLIPGAAFFELAFALGQTHGDIEIRLLNDAGFTARITGIDIHKINSPAPSAPVD